MHFVVLALRLAGVVLGVTLIGVGVPLFIMPIPLGLIVIALGVLVLIVSSRHAADWVRQRRQRNPGFDRGMRKAESALPGFIRGILGSTAPRGDSAER